MAQLLSCGADASITNAVGENALHFLDSLDEQDVYSAAHMLLASGAALDVDATDYTGSTFLQTRPTGGGCPRLRAVLSDNSHVLRVLLQLFKPSTEGAQIESHITMSKQRLMLAWAVRLHHAKVLEVLHEFFASSGLFSNLEKLRFWVDDIRQSLPEMCVRGCVSGTGTTGSDMPQEFIQLVHYGSNGSRYLEQTLAFLETLSPGILAMGCNGARNALFFAIREGRRDAVRILSMFETSPGKSLFVDSPTLSKKLDERGQQIRKIPARYTRYRLGKRFRFRQNPPYLSSITSTPRSFLTTSSGGPYDSESDQAYDDTPEPLLSKKQQRRRMIHRFRSMRSPMSSPYGSDSTDFSSGDEGPEDSDTEDNGDIRTSTAWDDARKEDEWKKPRPAIPVTADKPTDHYSLSSHVDAILLSVYYGKRAIFYDLISGPCSDTMRTESPFLCYAYHNSRAVFDLKHHNDFRGYFPRTAWDCPVIDVKGDKENFVEFDGRLCYPLAYMTAIARSVHRDICLAHILLMAMEQGDIPEPVGWTAKSWFEDKCLSLDACSGQSTPLFHAATLGWNELSLLLLDHGAFPQSACYYNSSGQIGVSTMLARLIVTTKNDEGKVQNLLAAASSRNAEVIVTVQDVSVIVGQSLHAGEHITWDHGVLSWKCSSLSNENSNVQLWQAVAAANSSQRQKLQHNKAGSSALLMEAACRRHLYAVATLLEIGVDPNIGCSSWLFISPRITALDIVAWTMYIRLAECDESGRMLKERDAKILALLRVWGGVRGVEYTVEYQLLMNAVHTLIIPIAGTGLLFYTLYSTALFIPGSWRQSWDLTNQCATEDDSSGVPETTVFFIGKLMAITWQLFVAITVACCIFEDPKIHRDEEEIDIAAYVMALMITVGIGAIFTALPCLTVNIETRIWLLAPPPP
ncbi:serine threonine kinase [Fusarium mexicanum]|uniref:Serine threonine kinase n=1 Tax=Fusarium mexicanum TaxID=751941 RepID=A0A8H5I8D4_9HYPO|nr:serine threonine kinase [Fusarium mexicanum]